MSISSLLTQYISASWQNLVQVSSSGNLYDGSGNLITSLSVVNLYGTLSGSVATASYIAPAAITAAATAAGFGAQGSNTYIQFNSASVFNGSSALIFDYNYYALANGFNVSAIGNYSHAEGNNSIASGAYSHAEGYVTDASGDYSHAEGESANAAGQSSHAEGYSTIAIGISSHSEGFGTAASGSFSHAEGVTTVTIGAYSHAEGDETNAVGLASHAEGRNSVARGDYSHAEGYSTNASGAYSHAEGDSTIALGAYSHTIGRNTIASGSYQCVMGQNNKHGDTTSLLIVGNGSSTSARSDAFEVRMSGSIVMPTTQSAAPAWTGTDGEIVPATVGGVHRLYMYMAGAWRSASFA